MTRKLNNEIETIEVTCDGCGDTYNITVDFAAYPEFSSVDALTEEAESQGWLVEDDWLCPECACDLSFYDA